MSIFSHFPSIIAHVYAKKSVSLQYKIKQKKPFKRVTPT